MAQCILLASRSLAVDDTFGLPNIELQTRSVDASRVQGLIDLKGHRSVGELHASIYTRVPIESARALAVFTVQFQCRHG